MSFTTTSPDSLDYATYWTSVLLAWTILFFIIRLYIRFVITKPFGHDDTALALGTLLSIGQSSVTLWAVQQGRGKQEEPQSTQIQSILKSTYTASLLYVLAISASKCSISLLILRFTEQTYHHVACKSVILFTIVWGIVAMFVIAFQCDMPQPWDTTLEGRCSNLFLRWVVIEAFSGFIEVALFTLSIYLVWRLKVPLKSKFLVVGAFLCRPLTIIPLAFRLHYLRMTTDAKLNIMTTITTQVVMHSCVMAATIPCTRKFLSVFNSWTVFSVEMQSPQDQWRYTDSTAQYRQEMGLDPDHSNGQAVTGSRIDRTQTDNQHYPDYEPQTETRSTKSDSSKTQMIRKAGNWPLVDGSQARTWFGSQDR